MENERQRLEPLAAAAARRSVMTAISLATPSESRKCDELHFFNPIAGRRRGLSPVPRPLMRRETGERLKSP